MKEEISGVDSNKIIKPRNGGTGIRIGSFVIVAFLLMYIPSLFHWVYGSNMIVDIIRMGAIEDSINVEGSFIRDEVLLESPYSGSCITEAGEGDKIPRSFKVATVLNSEYISTVDRIRELDIEILKMQKEMSEKEDFFSEDILKIDSSIEEKIDDIIYESSTNSFSRVRQMKNSINQLILKKAEIIGGTGTPNELLNAKRQEKESLQNQINSNKQEIIAAETGTISYAVDGYENILRPETIEQLTPEVLDDIKVKEAKVHVNNLKLQAGKPFAKVIRSIYYLRP